MPKSSTRDICWFLSNADSDPIRECDDRHISRSSPGSTTYSHISWRQHLLFYFDHLFWSSFVLAQTSRLFTWLSICSALCWNHHHWPLGNISTCSALLIIPSPLTSCCLRLLTTLVIPFVWINSDCHLFDCNIASSIKMCTELLFITTVCLYVTIVFLHKGRLFLAEYMDRFFLSTTVLLHEGRLFPAPLREIYVQMPQNDSHFTNQQHCLRCETRLQVKADIFAVIVWTACDHIGLHFQSNPLQYLAKMPSSRDFKRI